MMRLFGWQRVILVFRKSNTTITTTTLVLSPTRNERIQIIYWFSVYDHHITRCVCIFHHHNDDMICSTESLTTHTAAVISSISVAYLPAKMTVIKVLHKYCGGNATWRLHRNRLKIAKSVWMTYTLTTIIRNQFAISNQSNKINCIRLPFAFTNRS